jgi:hypothetical protein
MTFQPEDMKYAIPALAPFISSIVEVFVKPKLESIKKHFRGKREILSDPFLTQFEEYLTRTVEKCSYMTTLVFQNQKKRLEDLYIPLSLVPKGSSNNVLIDSYKVAFIPKHRKALIVDTGGMGKSTIAKFLLLSCVKEQKGIPVFIELRRLKADTSILDYICNEIAPIDGDINKDLILSLIQRGDFVFFFDGYDEIPSTEVAGTTNNLQDFIAKAGNNSFLLTSRPDDSVVAFNDFQAFTILPLTEEEAFSLFRLYDPQGEIAGNLIETLDRPAYTHVKQFLGNPLLASLLYISFEYEPDIPLTKHLFFEQVYEALFKRHDLSKGGSYIREKLSKLDIHNFHIVVRAFAFYSLREDEIEYDRNTLLNYLIRIKQRLPNITFSEDAFIDDLIKAVPIFTKDGHYYKWTHKSLRDYFAARYICQDTKGNQEKTLQLLCKQGRTHYGTLELCADIDYQTFRKTLVYDFVQAFCNHYESSYQSISKDGISDKALEIRKSLSFISQPVVAANIAIVSRVYTSLQNVQNGEYVVKIAKPILIIGNQYTLIYEILRYKQEEVFKVESIEEVDKNNLDNLIASSLTAYNKKDLIFFDDAPHQIWNLKDNFQEFSLIYVTLETYYDSKLTILDITKCRALKDELERERQSLSFEEELLRDGF